MNTLRYWRLAPQAFVAGYRIARGKGCSRWDSIWFGKLAVFVLKLAMWAKPSPTPQEPQPS